MTNDCLTNGSRRRAAPVRWWAPAALLLLLPAAAAGQSAAQYGRVWGAPGDSADAATQRVTVGASWLDLEGSGAKLAEDAGLVDAWRGFALFDYRHATGERVCSLRSDLTSDDQAAGRFALESVRPGVDRWRIYYLRRTHRDDPTADDPYLPDAAARRLGADPRTRWVAAGLEWSRHFGEGWRLRAGCERIGQEGTRAGLGRGLIGEPYLFGPPAALARNVWSHRAWFGGTLNGARLALDWNAEFQDDEGSRSAASVWRADPTAFTDRHDWDQERRTWNVRAGGSCELGPRVTLLANYGYLGRFSQPRDAVSETPAAVEGPGAVTDEVVVNAKAHTGAATLVWRPWDGGRVRAGALVQQLNQTGRSTLLPGAGSPADTRSSYEKERTRQVYSLNFQQAGGHGTVLTANWRHELADETASAISIDEFAGGSVLLRVQSGDRERTRDDLSLRLRRRLSTALSAGCRVDYRYDDIRQRNDALVGQYAQGDRTWSRLRGEAGLRARLARDLGLDAGVERLDEDIERLDGSHGRNDWDATRLFAVTSWQPHARLSLFTSFAWGQEEYQPGQALPAAALDPRVSSPAQYRGTTYRLSPGFVMRPCDGCALEGHYERVRNRDSVANDSDRWYGRATAAVGRGMDLSATYRRYAFTAGYDDDYRADVYGLALTARF